MAEMFVTAIGDAQLIGRRRARRAPLYTDFAQPHDAGGTRDAGCGTGALAVRGTLPH
jgi:hypothetical protein